MTARAIAWVAVAVLGHAAAMGAGETATATQASPAQVSTQAGFRIERFEIEGDRIDLPAAAREWLGKATGKSVTPAQLRQTANEVQRLLRSQGHPHALVQFPRQTLTQGVARVLIRLNPATTPGDAAASAGFEIRHFVVHGNTALAGEELDRILGSAAGRSVNTDTLRKTLGELRKAYVDRGFAKAVVRAPAQFPDSGRLVIVVQEGPAPSAASNVVATTTAPIPAPAAAAPRVPEFEVREYVVEGNTLLRPDTVSQVFTNATGPAVTLPQIQRALADLQLAYRERGFATVSVLLPRQQITNALVRVQVIEGVLSEFRVTGNRHFSSNNVVRALPSLKTNEVLDSRVFQRELDLANQNRDRQIFPTLAPGAEPGTSTLTLRVKDRLPLHGRLEVNNHATPGTPEWRINSSIQYNNLWQLEHQAGFSYGFTPEAFKREGLVDDLILNRPLISYVGGYYRLPLGGPVSVAEQIAENSTAFGYDEATRQYRLPPPGSRPDLSFVASRSSSSTGIQFTDPRVITQTPLLTIVSQDSGENLSINESVGARFATPLASTARSRLAFSAGLDAKRYFLESFNTNNFIITTVVTNAQGSQTIESRVASPQPARRNDAGYLPVSLVLDYSHSGSNGVFNANLALNGNLVGNSSDFGALAYSRDARGEFAKANLQLQYERKLPRDWNLALRGSGQAATGPLLSTEQFAVGGLGSVRGYFEGDEFGDAGWNGSVEVRTPFLATRVPTWKDYSPVWIRGIAFFDAGQRFLLDAPDTVDSEALLLGTGFGVSANLNNTLDLRIVLGWPLVDTLNTPGGAPRAYFSLGGQF